MFTSRMRFFKLLQLFITENQKEISATFAHSSPRNNTKRAQKTKTKKNNNKQITFFPYVAIFHSLCSFFISSHLTR